MKKIAVLIITMIFFGINAFGQTSVTNNNTITIQGNVYYFQPSTTPSSPPPTQSSDFLGSGSWYGEHAARAWASIADWVIDRCLQASSAIIGSNNERVFISAVHVFRRGDTEFSALAGISKGINWYDKQVRIDYWVVKSGSQMADGRRATRWFGF